MQAVYNITYLRGLFPDENYEDLKTLGKLTSDNEIGDGKTVTLFQL